jgi:4a-hydroxytetrahydrobiopterin dehydratase
MPKKQRKLKAAQIDKHYANISDWKLNSKKTVLTKKIEFPSFVAGLAFMAKIAVHAEIMGHHPTLELKEDGLTIKLTTNTLKSLSVKDFELAKRIDRLKIT